MSSKIITNMVTQAYIDALPICPYCGEPLDVNDDLTPAKSYDITYNQIATNWREYIGVVQLAHRRHYLESEATDE